MSYQVAWTLLLGATLAGCLPPLTNPVCSTDDECLTVGDGWCHCIDGLCFKFDCPAPPPCPDELVERHTDSDCAALSAPALLGAVALAPARGEDGRIAVVHAAPGGLAKVSLFTTDLEPAGPAIELGVPIDKTRAPVALGDGRFAVATSEGIRAVGDAEAGLLTVAVAASAPVPLAGGALLLVTTEGDVVRLSSAISESLAATVPPDATAEMAVDGAQENAVVVAGGTLSLIDLGTGQTVLAEPGGFTGAPALAAGRVLAVTLDGQLGGLLLGSAQPTTLSAATVGAKPFSPVVGERDIIYVASGASKHVHAIRYEGQVPVAGWTGGATTSPQLPDVPVGAALAGGGGRIYVPLLNGELVALDAGDGELIWRYALDGTPQGTPLASPKGGVLLLSGGRLARVYAPTAPAPDAPWPRRRHDAGSTALGAF